MDRKPLPGIVPPDYFATFVIYILPCVDLQAVENTRRDAKPLDLLSNKRQTVGVVKPVQHSPHVLLKLIYSHNYYAPPPTPPLALLGLLSRGSRRGRSGRHRHPLPVVGLIVQPTEQLQIIIHQNGARARGGCV